MNIIYLSRNNRIYGDKMKSTSTLEVNSSFERNYPAPVFGGMSSRRFSKKIEDLQVTAEKLVAHSLHHRTIKIDSIKNGTVYLQEGPIFKSPTLTKIMKDCEEVICFAATIGSGLEGEVARLTDENRLSSAYILDSMGSTVTENMVDRFHKFMKKRYKAKGKGVTLRFSPGYCDWAIIEQKKLFRALDLNRTDIELTDTCLMRPRKSVSGIFGILSSSSITPYNPCTECKKRDCPTRRK